MRKIHFTSSNQVWFGICLIVLGAVIAFAAAMMLINNNQKIPKPPSGALTSKSAPSSVKPSAKAVAAYSVAPTDPKYISIPVAGVTNARIIQLGLLASDSIAVPNNIYDTGWYNGSSRPGQAGAMFVYGHVSSWTAPG